MTTLIILTLILIGYILPAISGYLYIHSSHSKNGIYAEYDTDSDDFFEVFCPLINLVCILDWILESPKKKMNIW